MPNTVPLALLPPPPKLPKRGELPSDHPEYAEFLATGHVRFADSDDEASAELAHVSNLPAQFFHGSPSA